MKYKWEIFTACTMWALLFVIYTSETTISTLSKIQLCFLIDPMTMYPLPKNVHINPLYIVVALSC